MAHRSDLCLTPGTLWNKIQYQTRHALDCGALQPIDTHYEFLEEGGMRFLVRILANLARKEEANQAQEATKKSGKDFNPFLPYEEDLFVADISSTHLCLLNKYNVVDHHILIVTRDFEDQDTWLTEADFRALVACMMEIDGLAFYNGGRLAGASQRHKHLQLVPPPPLPGRKPSALGSGDRKRWHVSLKEEPRPPPVSVIIRAFRFVTPLLTCQQVIGQRSLKLRKAY
jgi:ATP adenylyltransferase